MEAGPRNEEARAGNPAVSGREAPGGGRAAPLAGSRPGLLGGPGVEHAGPPETEAPGRFAGDHGDEEEGAAQPAPEEPHELRPPRKLRLWQIAPVVGLGTLGSLMFAFPLAFEPGGGSGTVVAMLGLLLFGCATGWGAMAARRAGAAWPGLPARGSGRRADWRIVLLYTVVVAAVAGLAILRVARLG